MNRIHWLDSLRFIAIILVVFTHAHEQAGVSLIALKSFYFSIDRLGVPLFLMISGGLILQKAADRNYASKIYRQRIPQFFIILIFYCLMMNVFKQLSMGTLGTTSLFQFITTNNGVYPANQWNTPMWYMYVIIGLYLVAPFLSSMVKNMTTADVVILSLLILVLNQLPATLRSLGINIDILDKINTGLHSGYLFFFLIGYAVLTARTVRTSLFVEVLMFVLPVVFRVVCDYNTQKFNWVMNWYDTSLPIAISGVGLFLILKRFFEQRPCNSQLIKTISACSFGIYLSHLAFIYLTKYLLTAMGVSVSEEIRTGIFFVAGFTGGFIYTALMMRTKVTKYLVN
ncbi:acyltransferase [Kluyvera intermedia]|uniref:Acyltransferase family protein n=1 Tax=Kluyvera intermedia TaxID=61648 RepID=A0ABX6DPR1_KLUIN|nr:acyltransferase [Kluyvera intermedia]QGH30797.1 acyltransferase family protein [Kluyvera intermedia]QGH39779.1 acyltransferase family protein [Kluyvera intermedia]